MAKLSMPQGDYRQFQIAVTEGGSPVDITTIQSLDFVLSNASGVVATWGIGTGVALTDPTGGIAVLSVVDGMTEGLVAPYTYEYAWTMVDAIGNKTSDLEPGACTFALTVP